jgi:hypothetical protein
MLFFYRLLLLLPFSCVPGLLIMNQIAGCVRLFRRLRVDCPTCVALLFFPCLGLRAEIREEGEESVQRVTTSAFDFCMLIGASEKTRVQVSHSLHSLTKGEYFLDANPFCCVCG